MNVYATVRDDEDGGATLRLGPLAHQAAWVAIEAFLGARSTPEDGGPARVPRGNPRRRSPVVLDMHDRQPAPEQGQTTAAVAAAAPDALREWAANVGNARLTRPLGTPRALGRSPAGAFAQADLQLQRELARTLARAPAPPGQAASDRAALLASCPREIANNVPSTGIGMFDVRLQPPQLILTVKVRFVPSGRWTPDELVGKFKDFQTEWFKTASGFWRPGTFSFWSQRPGWEDLWITVNPVFRIAESGEKEHVLIQVANVPKGQGDKHHSTIDNQRHVAAFGSGDNELHKHPKGHRTTTSHEAGHLLGLGEEYVDGGAESTTIEAAHSKLAERQLGHKVYLGQTESVMSSGGKLFAQHSVTMREALERVSVPFDQWSLKRQPTRP